MKPTVWNLQYHRTVHTQSGTQSHDVYTLRRANPTAPYYTFSVPKGQDTMAHDLFDALNHRTVYEQPAELPEIEAIFHGPWTKSISNLPCLVVLESEVKTLRNTYFALAAKNITLDHELKTLKEAYVKLDKMFNLQSKLIQRLRHNNQPFEDEVAQPELPDMFRIDFDRSTPEFEYSKDYRGPL